MNKLLVCTVESKVTDVSGGASVNHCLPDDGMQPLGFHPRHMLCNKGPSWAAQWHRLSHLPCCQFTSGTTHILFNERNGVLKSPFNTQNAGVRVRNEPQ